MGGGNVAVDAARTAVRCNSGEVSMYCLESRTQMPASEEELEEAEAEGILLHNGYGPKTILTENGAVTGIEFKKCISVFDKTGRFAPVFDENDVISVKADNIILSVGQTISWGGLLENTSVKLNPNLTIAADSFTYQTGQPDIFTG
ncbi:FAD-dependent oxidoreductase, partial [Treponema pedis]|uniref:FAD-dependent oxidoreductase n=1 Tax=Treponema pedis TaxID=409322 RepID=UPI0021F3B3DD